MAREVRVFAVVSRHGIVIFAVRQVLEQSRHTLVRAQVGGHVERCGEEYAVRHRDRGRHDPHAAIGRSACECRQHEHGGQEHDGEFQALMVRRDMATEVRRFRPRDRQSNHTLLFSARVFMAARNGTSHRRWMNRDFARQRSRARHRSERSREADT